MKIVLLLVLLLCPTLTVADGQKFTEVLKGFGKVMGVPKLEVSTQGLLQLRGTNDYFFTESNEQ